MRTVKQCMASADARAQEQNQNVYQGKYNKYNNLSRLDNNNPPLSGDPKRKKRLNYNDYNLLKEKIHSDELYLLAQSWGTADKYLCELILEHGEDLIKRCILRVRNIQDRFFRDWEPIPPQRGKYLRKVILEEAKKRG